MKNTLLHIWNFYVEGFRSMTLGRTLWLIILVKLFIMFFILDQSISEVSILSIISLVVRVKRQSSIARVL